jgi:lysozyme
MISQAAVNYATELIIEGEGFSHNVYNDSLGHPTIGYGHKLLQHEMGKLTYVTKDQAMQMLKQKLDAAISETKKSWSNSLNNMSALRTAVILDMTYNMGSVRQNIWPKLHQAVRNCNWEEAGKEIMNSIYANQVKKRAVRNSAIMRDGQMHKK